MTTHRNLLKPAVCGLFGAVFLSGCAHVTQANDPHAVNEIVFDTRDDWKDSGVDVKTGARYVISARGDLRDAAIPTDADGYDKWYMSPFKGLRRKPDAEWFQLIGCVGETRANCKALGTKARSWDMPATGRLHFFVNDVTFFYWNNAGVLFVTVTKAP